MILLRQVPLAVFIGTFSLFTLKGGSAKAAGELVKKQGGKTLEYLFIIELLFLQASSRLDAPIYSIIQTDD